MKHSKIGLKWKVYASFAVFTAIIISLLWLFQIVFLDRVYKSIKIYEIKNAAYKISDAIRNDTSGDTAESISQKNDVCILILSTDSDGMITGASVVHRMEGGCTCTIESMISGNTIMPDKLNTLYGLIEQADSNGGTQLLRFFYDRKSGKSVGVSGGFFTDSKTEELAEKYPESILYTVNTEDADGNNYSVILNSDISPVNATVNTLNYQLILITIILVITAVILSLIMSRRISRPITKLTGQAKRLAEGNYDVDFNGRGYREIEELSSTLNYAEQELSKVDETRRELIANISHDLRTPLTMIKGYSEVIRDIPGENTAENIQVIIDEASRLTSLVNDVVDISRLESGVGKAEFAPVNLTALVRKSLERYGRLCAQDGYIIVFEPSSEITVNTDEKRIMQAIYNLINNALTYTGDDKLVRVTQTVYPGRVRISVIDTGEGIAPEMLPVIWERYYKIDKVHRRAASGSGLGLSIVRTVMDMLGGAYGVESNVGEGSCFWVELPTGNITEEEKAENDDK